MKARLSLERYQLRRAQARRAAVVGKGLSIELRGGQATLVQPFRAWTAQVDMPEARVIDLRYLNAFLPRGLGLKMRGGSGAMQGQFRASSQSAGRDAGSIRVTATKAALSWNELAISGDVLADLRVARGTLATGRFSFDGSRFALNKVTLQTPGNDPASRLVGWHGQVTVTSGTVQAVEPRSLSAEVTATGKDLGPLLAIYRAATGMPGWLVRILNLPDVRCRFAAEADETSLAIKNAAASAGSADVIGWYQQNAQRRRGRFLASYGPLSVGVGLQDEAFEVDVLGAKSWYDEVKGPL